MSYCPDCGSHIENENEGCPVCGYKPIIEAQVVKEETIQEETTQTDSQKEPQYTQSTKQFSQSSENNGLNILLKVIIVLLIVSMPGIGSIAGIVAGIILMGKDDLETKKFGKILLGLSVAMIAIFLICCCVIFMFYGMAIPYAIFGY